ncbi:MAG: uL15 family ribosomal protein [Candidatus Moranbacteria bacterium]|nr:uL15 family ribosomal protein [Candidatus Moranbacteria bacterium]
MTIKILGDGKLSKKLTIEKCLVSKVAKEKIEKAGGKVS